MGISPRQLYETKDGVIPLLSTNTEFNVGNNQSVIAGVAGYRIVVMGWKAISLDATTASNFRLKDGTGGTFFTPRIYAPPNANGMHETLDVTASGYFETTAGTGLFIDVITKDLSIFLQYVIYKPL